MKISSDKVNLDADHAGHLLCVICEYLNHIRLHIEDYLESDDTDARIEKPLSLMELFYMAGNLEGRILSNNIGPLDLELIEAWEEDLREKQGEEDVDEEDFTLVFSSHAPIEKQTQTVWLTARIRRRLKAFFPQCDPTLTWLTADAEEYGSIQLVMQILVSPEFAEAMTAAVEIALKQVGMSIDDWWKEEA